MADKQSKKAKDAKTVKSLDELKTELATKRKDLVEAKRSNAAGELVNPNILQEHRKSIARLLTEINAKENK